MSATSMVRGDRLDIDPAVWIAKPSLGDRAAAQEKRVERPFVNAAIKEALCREAKGDRSCCESATEVRSRLSLSCADNMSLGTCACTPLNRRHRKTRAAIKADSYCVQPIPLFTLRSQRSHQKPAADNPFAIDRLLSATPVAP